MKKLKRAIPVVDIQDEIIQQQAEQMAKSIDFEMLAILLEDNGWARVDISYSPPNHSWVDVKDWADQNCSGAHQEHMGIWLFENEKDAIIFKLRWA